MDICPANNRQNINTCVAHAFKRQMQRVIRVDVRKV